jgi:hypothetical protein
LVERFDFEEVEMKKMAKIIVVASILSSLYSGGLIYGCGCEQGMSDAAEVALIEMNPTEGSLLFSVTCYTTCADGWNTHDHDVPPIFLVYRPGECIN